MGSLLRGLTIVTSLSVAGFMLIDGSRAFILGDYIRPQAGDHAGQLGPWHHLAELVGVDPMSDVMKGTFITYGALWLLGILGFARKKKGSWRIMVVFAVGSLWYLVIGTLTSMLVLLLLAIPATRKASTPE